jgi:hypothetical protein
MKFSEFTRNEWADVQLYFDTGLLPVSGLTGGESPAEAAAAVGRTGDWLLPVETAFRGRTVTLPAYHYFDGSEEARARLASICREVKAGGFKHLIVVCGTAGLLPPDLPADLLLQPARPDETPDRERIREAVADLWRQAKPR